MKIVKKVFIVFLSVLLGLLFIFNIYNFVSVKVLKNDITTINGYAVLEVISGSMEPTIHIGDLIIINKNDKTYNEGDIVTFYDQEGSFVTHRIMSINKDEMVTKGDNNNSEDKPLPITNIVGKYVIRIPLVGRVLSSIKNPFILTMIFVLGLLICYFLSMDKNGELILTEEEKEYQEFLEYQNKGKNKKKKQNSKKQNKREETSVKKNTEKKNVKKKDTIKKEVVRELKKSKLNQTSETLENVVKEEVSQKNKKKRKNQNSEILNKETVKAVKQDVSKKQNSNSLKKNKVKQNKLKKK